MRNLLGSIIILLSLVLGIYVGFWVCLIGGVVQFIEVIKEPVIIRSSLAMSIAKICFSGFAAFLTALPGIVLAGVVLDRRIKFGGWVGMIEKNCNSCLHFQVVETEPKIFGICLNKYSAFFNCNTFEDCHCKNWEEIDVDV